MFYNPIYLIENIPIINNRFIIIVLANIPFDIFVIYCTLLIIYNLLFDPFIVNLSNVWLFSQIYLVFDVLKDNSAG